MKRIFLAGVIVSAALMPASEAWSAEYYLAGGLGSAKVHVKPEFLLDENESEQSARLELSAAIGIRFGAAYAQADIGSTFINSILSEAFGVDDYSLTSLRLSGGYDFFVSARWSVGPELSIVRAGFGVREGRLLNPGPEERSSVRDVSIGWGLQSKVQLSERSRLKLRYMQSSLDFGDTQLTSLVLERSF